MATTRDRPAAVALRYDPRRSGLPRVAAKERDTVAAQIVSIATAHGIALAAVPATLEVDSPIAAVAAVAGIPARLYRADGRIRAAASP